MAEIFTPAILPEWLSDCSKLGHESFVVNLGTLVQDGLAHIYGITWGIVPAKFKIDV